MEIIAPGFPRHSSSNMSEVCRRLIGRRYSSLTPAEADVAEFFSVHGEIYPADVTIRYPMAGDEGSIVLRTNLGDSRSEVTIRAPFGTPLHEACWDLADFVDFYMNDYLPYKIDEEERRKK